MYQELVSSLSMITFSSKFSSQNIYQIFLIVVSSLEHMESMIMIAVSLCVFVRTWVCVRARVCDCVFPLKSCHVLDIPLTSLNHTHTHTH